MRNVCLAITSVLASVTLHAADPTSGRFTVADSIEMVRIVDAEGAAQFSAESSTTAIQFSPDRSRFTLVIRNGNLKTGRNEYRLLLLQTEDVLRFVRSRGNARLPRPEVLVTFEIAQPRTREDGISHVKWIADSETFAFIGRDEDGIGQLYLYHVSSRQLRRLTQSTENIVGFDLTPEQKALLFVEKPSPNWGRRNTHGYAVKSESLNYLVTKDPKDAFREFTYFAADFHTGRLTPVHSEAGFTAAPSVTALSPTGRAAVVLKKVATVPAIWARYDFLRPTLALASRHGTTSKSIGDGARSQAIDEDWYGGGAEERWRLQFVLVDMTSGTSEPLVDAPISVYGPTQAAWSRDGSSVIVGATHLPLGDVSGEELDRRSKYPAIAEIDVTAGKIACVAEIRPRDAPNGQPIFFSSFHRMDDDWVVIRERVRGGGLELPLRSFRKRRGSWREERGPASLPAIHGLKIIISQDNDTPPELAAVDLKTSRRHVFTDLNPRFRSLSLGKTEKFEWTDRLGRHFVGGLLLPPDFKASVRYPAVIQNYGYDSTQFLVDGVPAGVTSAFAARPLASRGILVLQMDADFRGPAGLDEQASRTSADWLRRAESPLALVSIEGAIDALDARSLIDPARVGLIGWSRSGMHALHAITFGCRPIAAVSIADSHGTTPWIYVSTYGRGGMVEWESDILIGAPFWGDGIRLWQERSPAFHLDRIRTPLRYEHYGTYPPSFWDTFVMLKRHSRAVEMIHLPLAKHNLESPHARYTSQEGTVDWFDFWLNGHEDPDPAKSDQYNRWRKLRVQHEAHLRDVHPRGRTVHRACATSSGEN